MPRVFLAFIVIFLVIIVLNLMFIFTTLAPDTSDTGHIIHPKVTLPSLLPKH